MNTTLTPRTDAENDTQAELAAWELLQECRRELADAKTWSSKLADVADDLRAELEDAREQRDRLAEALRKIKKWGCAQGHCAEIAQEALATMEGGQDD